MVENETRLSAALNRLGISFGELRKQCSEVILFGSRAAGVEDNESDWDLLCVGNSKFKRVRGLDIIWLPSESVLSQRWVTSEIASHIAEYGRWMSGRPSAWINHVEITPQTRIRKIRWIQTHVNSWARFWSRCSPKLRDDYALKLRYNLQRLEFLLDERPTPPRQILEGRFSALEAKDEWFDSMLVSSGISSQFVTEELRPRALRLVPGT